MASELQERCRDAVRGTDIHGCWCQAELGPNPELTAFYLCNFGEAGYKLSHVYCQVMILQISFWVWFE